MIHYAYWITKWRMNDNPDSKYFGQKQSFLDGPYMTRSAAENEISASDDDSKIILLPTTNRSRASAIIRKKNVKEIGDDAMVLSIQSGGNGKRRIIKESLSTEVENASFEKAYSGGI